MTIKTFSFRDFIMKKSYRLKATFLYTINNTWYNGGFVCKINLNGLKLWLGAFCPEEPKGHGKDSDLFHMGKPPFHGFVQRN